MLDASRSLDFRKCSEKNGEREGDCLGLPIQDSNPGHGEWEGGLFGPPLSG